MLQKLDYRTVSGWLATTHRPMIVSHRRPDGDALGAIIGMSLALRELGKSPKPMLFEPPPPRYRTLNELVAWNIWPVNGAQIATQCDALIILDTCARQQLEPIAAFLQCAPRSLVIDHHATCDDIATRAGDLRVLDETASAVSLLVTEWITTAGISMSPEMAGALFTGIATDCGWFRYSNTDPRTLHIAAELVRAGAPLTEIYSELFQQDSEARVRLVARALASLQLMADGKLAVMRLRRADYESAGAKPADSEDIVNEAGRLGGIEAIILLNEEPDGAVRANFRSRTLLDVSRLAATFGGGGHARAAGARLQPPFDAAVEAVVREALAAIKTCGG